MTVIRVAQVHYPVTVLGPGTRLGIWVQGCHIGCRGCVARDTWDRLGAPAVPVERVVADCSAMVTGNLDGVTISGGEPFEQAEAVRELVDLLRTAFVGRPGVDFLCYSGLPMDDLRHRFSGQLAGFDAIIPEPYIAAQASDDAWRGSSNQPIVPLTPLGQTRYGDLPAGPVRAVQIRVTADRMTFIGIPRRSELAKIERRLAAAGVELEGVSWRP